MELSLYTLAGAVALNATATGFVLNQLYRRKPAMGSTQKIIIDTCGLIDGRLLDIVKAGFTPGRLLIPQAVIAELQYMADQADPQKRERARFGLDIVRELQALQPNLVTILPTPQAHSEEAVDDQLIELSLRHGALLYTIDYNLNKVAEIKGVQVLNVNELAQAIRARFLPGETAAIKVVQKGQDSSQGIGYLDDGTMVVIEKAGGKINQTLQVSFSRVLQTQAGKMMFAKLTSDASQKSGQKGFVKNPSGASKTHSQTTSEPGMVANSEQDSHKRRENSSKKPSSKHVQTPPVAPNQPHSPKPRRNKRRVSPEDSLLASIDKYAR